MIYILYGPDDYSLNQAYNEIKRGLGDAEMLSTSTTSLTGQVKPDELKNICETVPFLSPKRLVNVAGLLERFETRAKTSRQNKSTTAAKTDDCKPFAAALSSIPDSTVVIMVDAEVGKDNILLKELAGKALIKNFPLLKDPRRLSQWIERQVKSEGGAMSSRAVELLARLVGSNLWVLSGEIKKLVVFASGRSIEEEDVKSLVAYTHEADIFGMVDAIIESRTEIAERLLQRLLERGAAPAYILFMLTRQFRTIARARDMKSRKKSEAEMQTKLGISTPYGLHKTLEQANHYSLARLRDVYRRLLEADLSIKTGRYEGEFALNILVAELCGGKSEAMSGVRA